MKLRYPDFICIGAQKAGTTWLHYILARHPEIWLPEVKELQYFNQAHIPAHHSWIPAHRTEHAARARAAAERRLPQGGALDEAQLQAFDELAKAEASDEWYGRIFARAGAHQRAGEFTPEYALLPEDGVRHALALNPALKAIFIVRDPIDRAWSHIRMLVQNERRPDLEEKMASMAGLADVIGRCDYARTINLWTSLTPRTQFLLLHYDDIIGSPAQFVARVYDFLNIPPQTLPEQVLANKVHEGVDMAMPAIVYDELRTNLAPIYDDPAPELADIFRIWRAKHYPELKVEEGP